MVKITTNIAKPFYCERFGLLFIGAGSMGAGEVAAPLEFFRPPPWIIFTLLPLGSND